MLPTSTTKPDDAAVRGAHRLNCVGIVTGWAAVQLHELATATSTQVSWGLEELPLLAPAYIHVAKAQMAVTLAMQFIESLLPYSVDSLRPYANDCLLTEHPHPSHISKAGTIGLLASRVFGDVQPLLQTVSAQLLIALAKLTKQDTAYEWLKNALESAEEAAALMQKLSAFSQEPLPAKNGAAPDAASNAARIEQLDLTEIVQETLNLLVAVRPPHVSLQARLAPSLPPLFGDTGMLRLMIIELLINAVEAAMSSEGAVLVETGRGRINSGGQLFLAPRHPHHSDYLCLTVSDTGDGLAEERLHEIFHPHFSTKEGRAGLGLSIVREIVSLYDGAMQVYSQPGGGTLVKVLLPPDKHDFSNDAAEKGHTHG